MFVIGKSMTELSDGTKEKYMNKNTAAAWAFPADGTGVT